MPYLERLATGVVNSGKRTLRRENTMKIRYVAGFAVLFAGAVMWLITMVTNAAAGRFVGQ
jgi:hypothetical protein